jgi:hypothetical protein
LFYGTASERTSQSRGLPEKLLVLTLFRSHRRARSFFSSPLAIVAVVGLKLPSEDREEIAH